MSAATVFNDDPAAQARAFADAGCDWLHLVDLNGAFAGAPVNGAALTPYPVVSRSTAPGAQASRPPSVSSPVSSSSLSKSGT